MSIGQSKDLVLNAHQLFYILEQGLIGFHPLFGTDRIRRALETAPLDVDDIEVFIGHLQDIIRELTALADISAQRRYIDVLPEDVQDTIIKLYFRVLDQYMQQAEVTLH